MNCNRLHLITEARNCETNVDYHAAFWKQLVVNGHHKWIENVVELVSTERLVLRIIPLGKREGGLSVCDLAHDWIGQLWGEVEVADVGIPKCLASCGLMQGLVTNVGAGINIPVRSAW